MSSFSCYWTWDLLLRGKKPCLHLASQIYKIWYKQKGQLGRTRFSLLFLHTFSHTLKNPSNQLNMLVSVLSLKETPQTRITEDSQI